MFNGDILKQLRLLYGMTRKELATKLDITEQAVWQFEKNETSPKASVKQKMTNLFGVRSDYFFQMNSISNFDMTSVAFRNEAENTRKATDIQEAYLNTLDRLVIYLESMVTIPNQKIIDLVDIISQKDQDTVSLEEIALFAKRFLEVSNDNSDLLYQLEKSGIYIFERNMANNEDAYSIWSNTNKPFIILGIGKTAVRRNFDLAHELGHLLLHRNIDFSTLSKDEFLEKESEANNFASCFLLPKEEFCKDMTSLVGKRVSNPDNYIDLKRKYSVSIQALEYRAFKLGLVSPSQHGYFYRLIRKNNYKTFERLDDEIIVRRPSKVRSMLNTILSKLLTVDSMFNALKVNERFLSHLLTIQPQFFDKYKKTVSDEDRFDNIIHLKNFNKRLS
ncbi:XRE family transcriptional regulator [Streptococcus sanguinis]|mgnify:CR=1 FL=1|jgi:transcriptional regulator|nr:XRE family transcriptional regulator [Streptococcus sanguinis]MCY7040013.1 XRE family transcriptional regulator [Streptococcus sanguinis]RKW03310.1 MAG: ImmA/IrrE family metallo-endopeptidase [Streptococcus sp.]